MTRQNTLVVVELGGTLEQPAVQVEDVSGVGLASRRPAKYEGELPVGLRLFGQIIVHAERVTTFMIHEVLGHGATAVRCDVLKRRAVAGVRRHDDRMLQRAFLLEPINELCDGRRLLADPDVDTDDVTATLVDNRIHGDGGLARPPITDDQLPLASADGCHRVDGLDAGIQRLFDRLAKNDSGRLSVDLHSL